MRRRGRIGIEISPEGIRAVALSSGRNTRLLAWAEQAVSTQDEMPDALTAVLTQLAVTGPVHLVLFGANSRFFQVQLPRMSRRQQREALQLQAAQQLDDIPGAYLSAHTDYPPSQDGSREFSLLYLPREPLSTWASMLAAAGHPVESVATPGAQLLDHIDAEKHEGSLLWVAVGGGRTGLSFLRNRELALTREIPSRILEADDPVAVVEKRLTDFQEIERSLLFYQQSIDQAGVSRVVLCGAREETTPLREQLALALKELGIEIELNDPWDEVERGNLSDPLVAARLANAVLAATTSRREMSIVPESTVKRHRRSRLRLYGVLAAAALAIAAGGLGLATLNRGDPQHQAEERTPGESLTVSATESSGEEESHAEATAALPAVPDWSGVLEEAGLLARPGIDYERLVLTLTDEGPILGFEGVVGRETTQQTGLLMAALHEGLLRSPYSSSLPRLAARSATAEGNSERVRFAIESVVSSQADASSGSAAAPPLSSTAPVPRHPFATWAHLVAGLHEAAGSAMLERFNYETRGVTPVPGPQTPSYRAMGARVMGTGSYDSIVRFIGALAQVSPPLELDELVISAEATGPRFDALVHLMTSLPVEKPRVINLGREDAGWLAELGREPRQRQVASSPYRRDLLTTGGPAAIVSRPGTLVPLEDPEFLVSVILWDPERPVAQVSGRVVEVADVLGAYVVERIDPESIVLAHESGDPVRWIAELGKPTRRMGTANPAPAEEDL